MGLAHARNLPTALGVQAIAQGTARVPTAPASVMLGITEMLVRVCKS